MAFWLMKTEPTVYSYDDLERAGRDLWDGVRNAAAARNMRAMRPGDLFLFYHTGDERAVVGVGRIVSEPYPDPTDSEGRWVAVDVEPLYRFRTPVTLADVKADPRFADWALVRQSRLSVMPVSQEQWAWLHEMGGTELREA
ncbi:EVE domain-containing protein [Symbiobacterium thermophilum]|nr:EVE domain-containing protein [Symbiobacterium thermophilum]MBY6276628.1 EVE domain-containing protein [Symbiobacterium thermophilum]